MIKSGKNVHYFFMARKDKRSYKKTFKHFSDCFIQSCLSECQSRISVKSKYTIFVWFSAVKVKTAENVHSIYGADNVTINHAKFRLRGFRSCNCDVISHR